MDYLWDNVNNNSWISEMKLGKEIGLETSK